MRAVEVFPLVPVMWIDGYAFCGSPSASSNPSIRPRSKTIRAYPRPASPCSAAANRSDVAISLTRQRVELAADAGQLRLGRRQPLADLRNDRLGSLSDERRV